MLVVSITLVIDISRKLGFGKILTLIYSLGLVCMIVNVYGAIIFVCIVDVFTVTMLLRRGQGIRWQVAAG